MIKNVSILLNDILGLDTDELKITKVRFVAQIEGNWNPTGYLSEELEKTLLDGQYWNYAKTKQFKVGQITIGLLRKSARSNEWILFHVGRVTKDLDVRNGRGYEFEIVEKCRKYFGRVIVRFDNHTQQMNRMALAKEGDSTVIGKCEVVSILPDRYDDKIVFPGYENVNISWEELSKNIGNRDWVVALQNQKGVYLITDIHSGKMYVGSAYGLDMLLGRWTDYAKTLHGNNADLKQLVSKEGPDYIRKFFRYSILDIFKNQTDDQVIINRESYWKEVLMTRKFGYNKN